MIGELFQSIAFKHFIAEVGINQEKKLVIGYGWLEDVWESAQEYYMDNEGWSEKKFDNYWENGGEDKESDEYIAMTVDNYDEESNWKDLEGVE